MADDLLTFIETPIFTQDRIELLPDDEYQKFQAYMLEHHHLGDYIPHTGGCQKIRWKLAQNHKGKSAGIRVIYYVLNEKGKLYLISAYAKSTQETLSEQEKAIMHMIVQKLKKE